MAKCAIYEYCDIVAYVNENISSITIRTSAPADIIARKPRSAHCTVPFAFLILSSSHPESVICSPPNTTAHTAIRPKNHAI